VINTLLFRRNIRANAKSWNVNVALTVMKIMILTLYNGLNVKAFLWLKRLFFRGFLFKVS